MLRNKATEQTYLVILFTILPKDFVNEDGTIKEGARDAAFAEHANKDAAAADDDERDETADLREAQEMLGAPTQHIDEKTTSDDID